MGAVCLLRFRTSALVVADIPLIAAAFWHRLRTLCRCISHWGLKKLFCALYISRRFVVFKLTVFRRNIVRLTLRAFYVVIRHIFDRCCCSDTLSGSCSRYSFFPWRWNRCICISDCVMNRTDIGALQQEEVGGFPP
jgi:hypothetical protein